MARDKKDKINKFTYNIVNDSRIVANTKPIGVFQSNGNLSFKDKNNGNSLPKENQLKNKQYTKMVGSAQTNLVPAPWSSTRKSYS